jgi:hypothetical protein
MPYLTVFMFVIFVFRKKNVISRNDFLDCMIELRQASKDEMKGDTQSAQNENTGETFGKLQYIFVRSERI